MSFNADQCVGLFLLTFQAIPAATSNLFMICVVTENTSSRHSPSPVGPSRRARSILFRSHACMHTTTRASGLSMHRRRGLVYSKLSDRLHACSIKAQSYYNMLSIGSRLGYRVLLFRLIGVSLIFELVCEHLSGFASI